MRKSTKSDTSIYQQLVSIRKRSRQISETSEEKEYIRILLPIVKQILSKEMAQKTFFDHYEDCFTVLYDGRKAQDKISDEMGFLRDRVNLTLDGFKAEDAFIERYTPEEEHAD